jgi:hypothetical protein
MTFHTNGGENYDDVVIVHNPLPPVGKRQSQRLHQMQRRTFPRPERRRDEYPSARSVPKMTKKMSLVRLPAAPQGEPRVPRPKRTSYIQRKIEDAKNSVVDDDFINFAKTYHNIN